MNESKLFLRRLLSQRGSHPIIAADHEFAGIEALRLAALVHEEPQESLPKLLGAAGVCDFAPTVVAVTGGFGQAIPEMERAAEVGGLQAALKCWAERLAGAAPPKLRSQRTALRAAAEPPGR